MNFAETNDLLAFIASYDNRRFDDATVLAWHPIFAELPLPDCRAAVTEHFATSDVYLMPVHIRRIVEAVHRERRRVERESRERLALEAEAADPTRRNRSPEVSELIAQVRADLPPGDPDKLRRAEWLEVEKARAREARLDAGPNPYYDPSAILPDIEPDPTTGAQR